MMKLYSAWYCPFAQRAWLALLHKKFDFKYIEIDPYAKTEQWLRVSRQTGQVPVVVTPDGQRVVDSNRIMEFIDLINPHDTLLFSKQPSENAEQKYWVDYVNNKVIPYFYRFLKNAETKSIGCEAKLEMLKGIMNFTDSMHKQGTFFSGESVGAVDLAFIPFAYRIKVLLKHYRDFDLPVEGKVWQRYHHWYNCNIEDSMFQKTSVKQFDYEKRLIEFYLIYSQGGGQTDVGIIN